MNDSGSNSLFDQYLDLMIQGEILTPEQFGDRVGQSLDGERDAISRLHGLIGKRSPSVTLGQSRATRLPITQVATEHEIAGFRLLRILGQGGMGVVYLAEQPQLDRLCALKVMRSGALASPTSRERFRREARAAARIQHEHVVPIHDAGEDKGRAYIAMAFVPGRSLDEIIRTAAGRGSGGEALEIGRVLTWGRQIAEALEAIHREGIVHRDLKPGNILIDPKDRAILTDFGLAKDLGGTDPSLTSSFTGTPRYAAPEQVHRRSKIDVRTDVYGLAVTLYESITLRAAFPGDTMESVCRSILDDEAPSPRSLVPGLPKDLEVILRKGMEKRPEDRFQSAAEFGAELERLATFQPILTSPPGWAGRLARWCRRKPELAAALAAFTLILVILIGIAGYRELSLVREQAREASNAVQQAHQEISDFVSGRAAYEKVRWELWALESEMDGRLLSEAELKRRDFLRVDLVNRERAREVALELAATHIQRAEELGADESAIDDAKAALYYEKWLERRSSRQGPLGKLYHKLFRQHAKSPKWQRLLEDNSAVTIHSDPEGAHIWIFAFRYQDELVEVWPDAPWIADAREHRLVACPLQDHAPTMMPGRAVLEILDSQLPLKRGDLIYEVNGQPWRRGLDETLPAGSSIKVWNDGKPKQFELTQSVVGRCTLSVPFLDASRPSGITPIEGRELNTGGYLAVLKKKGWEPLRYSFHVDFHADPFHKPGHADGRLLLYPKGSRHPDFIRVTAESYRIGPEPPYEMMSTEITVAQYLEFVNDNRRRALASDHVPRRADGMVLWPNTDEDQYTLPADSHPDHPVTGISWHDAVAFAKWYEMRGGDKDWEYGLPSMLEWRRSAFGGDSRTYVFGDSFRPNWVRSRFAIPTATLEPVGRRPHDEGVFGHRDLCGGVAEWGRPEKQSRNPNAPVFGGSWADGPRAHFRNDAIRRHAKEDRADWIGFRLVRRPKRQ